MEIPTLVPNAVYNKTGKYERRRLLRVCALRWRIRSFRIVDCTDCEVETLRNRFASLHQWKKYTNAIDFFNRKVVSEWQFDLIIFSKASNVEIELLWQMKN